MNSLQTAPALYDELIRSASVLTKEHHRFEGKHLRFLRSTQCAASLTAIKGAHHHTLVHHLHGSKNVKRFRGGRLLGDGSFLGSTSLIAAHREDAWLFPRPVEVLHLYFEDVGMRRFAEQTLDIDADKLEFTDCFSQADPFMAQLVPHPLSELSQADTVSPLMMDQYEMLLIGHILRRYGNLGTTGKGTCDTHASNGMQAAMERARDYIEAHLDGTMEMEELAAAAELRPWRFARAFKRVTGKTPYQYILNRRIEQAQAMLKGDQSLIDIAYACGFSSQQHMTNIFSKRIGVTPAQYRRELAR